jgi:hypothetical protein
MPLTDELGHAALHVLRDQLPPRLALSQLPRGLNFEAWLSQLASDQPYLSDGDNAQNKAAFLLLSGAIAEVLGDRVSEVLASEYPEWLLQFVSAAHHSQATVITFNYDPLIECMVATPTGILGDPSHYGELWNGVSWTELTGGLPPWAPGGARVGSQRAETLRLLKLHGSLNWYWRSGDASGISVARRSLPGYFGSPLPYTEEERRREVPGRVPFVVPPAASKSEYYSDPIVKEMWTQAAERLSSADRVALVGYSLPVTDVTFSNMLRESIGARSCSVDVVDFDPVPVRDRLVALGIDEARITMQAPGPTAVEGFVTQWLRLMSANALQQLRDDSTTDARIVLAWGDRTAYAPAHSVRVADGEGTVIASRVYPSLALATGVSSRPAVTLAEVSAVLGPAEAGVKALSAQVGHFDPRPIAAAGRYSAGAGAVTGEWRVLQVAGCPPAVSDTRPTG